MQWGRKQARAGTGVPLEDTWDSRSHLASSLFPPALNHAADILNAGLMLEKVDSFSLFGCLKIPYSVVEIERCAAKMVGR